LYANHEGTICVLVCETPILLQGIHRVLDAVMKWALDSNVTNALVLEGMPMKGIPRSKRKPFIPSNAEEDHTLINKLNAQERNLGQSNKIGQEAVSNKIDLHYSNS
jgi:uncharacterized protein